MASSTYKVYTVFCNMRQCSIPSIQEDYVSLVESRDSDCFFVDELEGIFYTPQGKSIPSVAEIQKLADNKKYIIISGGNYHTCRETALNSVRNLVEKNHEFTYYGLPVVVFQYQLENNYKLSQSRIDESITICDRIFGAMSGLKAKRQEGSFSINCDITKYSNSRYLYYISLLLWIFRVDKLREACADYIRRNPLAGQVGFLRWLSIEFLKHSDWGNGSNPTIGLSMFCHHYNVGANFGSIYKGRTNGPANAVYLLSFYEILSYIKNVMYPNFKNDDSGIMANVDITNGGLYGAFWEVWNLYKNKRAEENAEVPVKIPTIEFSPGPILMEEDDEEEDADFFDEDWLPEEEEEE